MEVAGFGVGNVPILGSATTLFDNMALEWQSSGTACLHTE